MNPTRPFTPAQNAFLTLARDLHANPPEACSDESYDIDDGMTALGTRLGFSHCRVIKPGHDLGETLHSGWLHAATARFCVEAENLPTSMKLDNDSPPTDIPSPLDMITTTHVGTYHRAAGDDRSPYPEFALGSARLLAEALEAPTALSENKIKLLDARTSQSLGFRMSDEEFVKLFSMSVDTLLEDLPTGIARRVKSKLIKWGITTIGQAISSSEFTKYTAPGWHNYTHGDLLGTASIGAMNKKLWAISHDRLTLDVRIEGWPQ